MAWLLSLLPSLDSIKELLRKARPEMFALVAVIAFSGVAVTFLGSVYVGELKEQTSTQRKTINDLVDANKGWKDSYQRQIQLRIKDQQAVLEIQEELLAMRESSSKTHQTLAELRQSNEEIRNYLDRPIPVDLQRMREQAARN